MTQDQDIRPAPGASGEASAEEEIATSDSATGLFITFEGSEGCGKSTQIALLRERLEGAGMKVLLTREPGGTAIGEKIRSLLQYDPEGEALTPEAELLLFSASRAQLVRDVIGPALEAGTHVVADRFFDSTTVYQGAGRGLDLDIIRSINRFVSGNCVPDITFLLDMDAATARERAHVSTKKEEGEGVSDRMENQPAGFYELVRAGYLGLAQAEPERFAVLDAARDSATIAEEIWSLLKKHFHGVFP